MTVRRESHAGKWPSRSAADYHTWHTELVTVRGVTLTTFLKPGLPDEGRIGPTEALLAEALELAGNDRIVDLNSGVGVVGMAAARLATAGEVVLTNSNLIAHQAATAGIKENKLGNATAVISSGGQLVCKSPPWDIVTLRAPRGRLASLRYIRDAYDLLKPAGRLYIAGANQNGIKSSIERAERLFDCDSVVTFRKGHRVAVLTRRNSGGTKRDEFADRLLDHGRYHEYIAEIGGVSIRVCSAPTVFSWEGLDDASRFLLEHITVEAFEDVLDLGAGTGVIGAFIAKMHPRSRVVMVDVDLDAVNAAAETIRINGITNCSVLLSDSTEDLTGRSFSTVVSNPPFHVGALTQYDVVSGFFYDAFESLRPGGRLVIVANKFLPYELPLRTIFGSNNVEVLSATNKYKLVEARRK